jgi:C4-dicarboxylate transporter DctM subunit
LTALLLGGLVLLLLVLRQNVILILAVVTAFVHEFVASKSAVNFLIQDIWTSLDREALLSIPMFLLAGLIMARGSIARRLVKVMTALTSPFPGGLGVAAVLSMAVFGAAAASGMVTMLAIGTIMYPALLASGYSKNYAVGVICSGATLGAIIPPSLLMIVYGIVTEVSITDLFTAGWGPGLVMTGLFAAYTVATNYSRPTAPFDFAQARKALWESGPSLLMPVILLGGIYTGFFTITESAALALLYALIVEMFIHREMTWRELIPIFLEATKLLGILMPLVAIASSLNVILDYEGVPQRLVKFMQSHTDSELQMLIYVNALLILAGALMDEMSAIATLAPILAPIGQAYGFDPVHFGTIVIVNLQIGYVCPPVALNLFVAVVAFKVSFGTAARAVLPFIALMLVTLVVTCAFPQLSLFLLR